MGIGVKRSSDTHDAAGGGGSGSASGLTVTTWPDQPPPSDTLQLTLTNSSGLPNPIQYNIVPLIGGRGLNGSDTINQVSCLNICVSRHVKQRGREGPGGEPSLE